MLANGIIVSIQNYSLSTTQELAEIAIEGGAIAIRTDQPITINKPIIGLKKYNYDRYERAYITPAISDIVEVAEWSNYVAVDYRSINKNLKDISEYTKEKNIDIVADIATIEDYQNIKKNNYNYMYLATTLSVLKNKYAPDLKILSELYYLKATMIIAEGNFSNRGQIRTAYEYCNNICIGGAISDINKLTQKFTSVRKYGNYNN